MVLQARGRGAGGLRRGRASNLLAARLLDEIARMLQVQGGEPHRVRAYRTAARQVAAFPESIEALHAERRLRAIPGVGASIEALLAQLVATGHIDLHQRLAAATPPGVADLLDLPGMSTASARALYRRLGVTSLDELEAAAHEGRLEDLGGYSPERVARVLAGVEQARAGRQRTRLKTAWEQGREIEALLRSGPRGARAVSLAGSARRMQETVGTVVLVAEAGESGPTRLVETFVHLPNVTEVLERGARTARVRLYGGIEARLHVAAAATSGAALLWHTGARGHVAGLEARARFAGLHLGPDGLRSPSGRLVAGRTEEDVYRRLGLPWIPPEIREDDGEIDAAADGRLPRLVEQSDVRGDLHVHTDWTDGSLPLAAMAAAARTRGYQYMALTDHSQHLRFIGGLSPERLREQRRLVEQVNQRLAPFVVFHGTEMDVLEDGTLDFPEDVLKWLDYVSASVHRRHKQDRATMTARIVRAVSHPLVHTFNHPFGRLLGSRDPYPVDMPRVLQVAARNGVALEVSSDPARMDLDGTWARRARVAGARCTISTDAHGAADFDNLWLGIGSARRGWLTREDVLNTLDVEAFRAALKRHTHQAQAA
ncbi:MAG: DNA polymerase III [Chloroflexi bacterium]|nr:DNA polymerase III [Chloroflexota bacterium]